jgi:hypothetical protein
MRSMRSMPRRGGFIFRNREPSLKITQQAQGATVRTLELSARQPITSGLHNVWDTLLTLQRVSVPNDTFLATIIIAAVLLIARCWRESREGKNRRNERPRPCRSKAGQAIHVTTSTSRARFRSAAISIAFAVGYLAFPIRAACIGSRVVGSFRGFPGLRLYGGSSEPGANHSTRKSSVNMDPLSTVTGGSDSVIKLVLLGLS